MYLRLITQHVEANRVAYAVGNIKANVPERHQENKAPKCDGRIEAMTVIETVAVNVAIGAFRTR